MDFYVAFYALTAEFPADDFSPFPVVRVAFVRRPLEQNVRLHGFPTVVSPEGHDSQQTAHHEKNVQKTQAKAIIHKYSYITANICIPSVNT